jgi:ComF family protein
MCTCCGAPFEYEIGEGAWCAACIDEAPIYRKARSILVFDEASKPLIHKLKFQDDTYLADIFAVWMHQYAELSWSEVDIVVPVPLNRWRLLFRRYNQSALLAQRCAQKANLVFKPELLVRTRRTQPQTGLTKKERDENVRGAFRVPDSMHMLVENMRILLVDDVMTTGATIHACTKTLLNAGAKHVDVLTLSRVVRTS